jgi:hypothetical protein
VDLKTWRNSASWTTVLCHPVTNSTTAHTNFRDSVYWAHCLSCGILTALDGDFILIFIVIKLVVGWTGDLIIWNLNQTSFLSSKIFFNQNNSKFSVYWAHCLSCGILTALDGDFILIFIVIKLVVGWTGDLIIWNLNQTSFLSSKIFFNQNNSVIFIKKKTKTKLFLVKKFFELAPQFASCLGWVRSWNYSYKSV